MIKELLAAMVGTIAFSVLFGVPKKRYFACGVIGMLGWLVYRCTAVQFEEGFSTILAAFTVVLFARIEAVRRQCPVTLFLVPGIFPLVPGSGIYLTVYYMVTGQADLASKTGYSAVKCTFAIVLGIVLAFELPQKLFRGRKYDKE